jgi:hypothetical protein
MATTIYNAGLRDIIAGAVRLESDTIVAMLVDENYTNPPITDEFVTDITSQDFEAQNAVGTGYQRKVVTGKEFIVDDVTNNTLFRCDELRWTNIQTTDPLKFVVFYRQGFNDDTSRLLFAYEIPLTETVGADLLIRFDDNIAINVTRTP